jgi:Family of unknown function (DUF5691)
METSYDDLVTTATVGLSRRPLPVAAAGDSAASNSATPDQDPADVLLDAAALHAVARRAGMLPARGVSAPPPMAADAAPELPPRAAQALRQATSDTDLLADLLLAAADAGYRAPAPLLPLLLDTAVRTVALRPAVNATLGTRGRWLAAHRAEWQRIADTGARAGTRPADPRTADPRTVDPRTWETGTRAERIGYLSALRDRDPRVARDLLAGGWTRETAEERAQLLAVLSHGLSLDDEDFLEAALDDRAAAVRATARGLLSSLPASGFNRRAADRAAGLLSLRGDGRRHWLAATLPPQTAGPAAAAARAALERDGITGAAPGPGIGAGAWELTQLIAAAPVATWTSRFAMGADDIVSLPIEGDLGLDVHAGWRLAAVRQGNAEWAVALLSGAAPLLAPGRPPGAWAGNDELAAALDPATRASLAASVFTRMTRAARELEGTKSGNRASATTIVEFTAWPGPWPDAVTDYVLGMVAASLSAQGAVRVLQGLVAASARNASVTGPRDYAADLIRMTQRPDCAYPWLTVLRRGADTLTLRRAFHAALKPES